MQESWLVMKKPSPSRQTALLEIVELELAEEDSSGMTVSIVGRRLVNEHTWTQLFGTRNVLDIARRGHLASHPADRTADLRGGPAAARTALHPDNKIEFLD